MVDEKQVLENNGTWDLASLLAGKKAIGYCWMFVVKLNPNRFVARLKACPIAKGYAQTYRVDYSDLFPLVARMAFTQLFFSLANFQIKTYISLISRMCCHMKTQRRKFIWSNI